MVILTIRNIFVYLTFKLSYYAALLAGIGYWEFFG